MFLGCQMIRETGCGDRCARLKVKGERSKAKGFGFKVQGSIKIPASKLYSLPASQLRAHPAL